MAKLTKKAVRSTRAGMSLARFVGHEQLNRPLRTRRDGSPRLMAVWAWPGSAPHA